MDGDIDSIDMCTNRVESSARPRKNMIARTYHSVSTFARLKLYCYGIELLQMRHSFLNKLDHDEVSIFHVHMFHHLIGESDSLVFRNFQQKESLANLKNLVWHWYVTPLDFVNKTNDEYLYCLEHHLTFINVLVE